ncbi:putative nuclear fragile X mental retardation-interacting protein 1 [Apostichopus japonicus]|uniref:Putative nuclear fragile X mental retardation-interacting protein 1 n=1 Tax=Stichopus japonicus TaxID=307972 RepID=A0A2G8KU32_STIJA|nr:putative nuclear fragile X mental retardation-interacting protein 1 [Apostichopus japonicus]
MGRAPPGFPPRPRGPHWQDVPDLGPQSPPPMLGHPRKRRRSSGSPHRGEPRPLMAVRPTNVQRDGPTLFDPRGHQSQPFHPESFRDLQPPKLPNKMSIPQFLGTKSGTFGKYLTEIKRKLKIEQQRSEAKIDAKKSQDVKFLCDVCQVGFMTKEEESEHRNQHKQCDVEGCRFEGISKVLEVHKQQAHQPNIPAVKWSRDTDDVKAWLEERKRNFPTNANITAKKAVEEDKERVGAVLVTKEFGKMRGKKKKIVQTTEGGNEETKEDETTEENKVKEQEVEEGEKEAMATSDEEGTSKDKTDEKGNVEMENPEQKEVEKNKIEGAVEKKEEENMTVDEDLTESDDKEVATENISDDKQDITDLTESNDKEVATENKSGDKEDISVTKEVVFQRVKKEVVRRFKSGKGSKRDAWRNSRPIKKGVPAPGGRHSKVTLLEMLLAPEMRHERNLVLQCVRHIVNNDFFEPKEVAETKDVGFKDESIPPVPKETTAGDEEQNVEIGTRAREEEEQDEGGKVDKGMSSSKLKDEDMNEADQIEDMACDEDGKVHQEEEEMRVLTGESVKDEANKSQTGGGKGDASCSTGTMGLSVGVSVPKEKTLLIGEEKETSDLGDEEMMVDNHDDDDKESDADSEKLQLGTDEDVDASNGKDKVAVNLMEDKFFLVEDMDDSEEVGMPAEQKMETSEGQQEWKITEEVAASVDDDGDDDDDQGGIGEGLEEGTQEGTIMVVVK